MEENKNLNAEPKTVDEAVSEVLQQGEAVAAARKKFDWRKEVREWVIALATALMVLFFVRTFFFDLIRVDGSSMSTTLVDGERLIVNVIDQKLNGSKRGDIVICHYPNRGKTNFVKRVVAEPGDQVYRENGVTHVVYETVDADGNAVVVDEMLDERMAFYFMSNSSDDYAPYTLGENEFFVVGDNRYNSHDSRDWNDSNPNGDVGPITGDMIVGKVSLVVWPLNAIRVP